MRTKRIISNLTKYIFSLYFVIQSLEFYAFACLCVVHGSLICRQYLTHRIQMPNFILHILHIRRIIVYYFLNAYTKNTRVSCVFLINQQSQFMHKSTLPKQKYRFLIVSGGVVLNYLQYYQ